MYSDETIAYREAFIFNRKVRFNFIEDLEIDDQGILCIAKNKKATGYSFYVPFEKITKDKILELEDRFQKENLDPCFMPVVDNDGSPYINLGYEVDLRFTFARKKINENYKAMVPNDVSVSTYSTFFHEDFLSLMQKDDNNDEAVIDMYEKSTVHPTYEDFCFVVYKNNVPVSGLSLCVDRENARGHIALVQTVPLERGKGYSTLCMKEAMNYCIEQSIKTIDLNTETDSLAHNIYKKFGFEELFTSNKYIKSK